MASNRFSVTVGLQDAVELLLAIAQDRAVLTGDAKERCVDKA